MLFRKKCNRFSYFLFNDFVTHMVHDWKKYLFFDGECIMRKKQAGIKPNFTISVHDCT